MRSSICSCLPITCLFLALATSTSAIRSGVNVEGRHLVQLCGECPLHCTSCICGECSACADEFYLQHGVCYARVEVLEYCGECDAGCNECSCGVCTRCHAGYRLENHGCIPSCGECGAGCGFCHCGYCVEWKPGHVRENGICVEIYGTTEDPHPDGHPTTSTFTSGSNARAVATTKKNKRGARSQATAKAGPVSASARALVVNGEPTAVAKCRDRSRNKEDPNCRVYTNTLETDLYTLAHAVATVEADG